MYTTQATQRGETRCHLPIHDQKKIKARVRQTHLGDPAYVGLKKDFTLAKYKIHRSSCYAPSSNESDQDDFDHEALLIEPTNVTNCNKLVHRPQHNHGRTDHGLKQINHGKIIGNILAGDIHKTCLTHQNHKWRWLPQHKKIIHRRQVDTTDTTGEHHDSHHLYSKQFVSFFCSCESFFVQHVQTCPRIFRCIGKRERKASSLLSNDSEKISDNGADMDYNAALPTGIPSWRRLQARRLVSARF